MSEERFFCDSNRGIVFTLHLTRSSPDRPVKGALVLVRRAEADEAAGTVVTDGKVRVPVDSVVGKSVSEALLRARSLIVEKGFAFTVWQNDGGA